MFAQIPFPEAKKRQGIKSRSPPKMKRDKHEEEEVKFYLLYKMEKEKSEKLSIQLDRLSSEYGFLTQEYSKLERKVADMQSIVLLNNQAQKLNSSPERETKDREINQNLNVEAKTSSPIKDLNSTMFHSDVMKTTNRLLKEIEKTKKLEQEKQLAEQKEKIASEELVRVKAELEKLQVMYKKQDEAIQEYQKLIAEKDIALWKAEAKVEEVDKIPLLKEQLREKTELADYVSQSLSKVQEKFTTMLVEKEKLIVRQESEISALKKALEATVLRVAELNQEKERYFNSEPVVAVEEKPTEQSITNPSETKPSEVVEQKPLEKTETVVDTNLKETKEAVPEQQITEPEKETKSQEPSTVQDTKTEETKEPASEITKEANTQQTTVAVDSKETQPIETKDANIEQEKEMKTQETAVPENANENKAEESKESQEVTQKPTEESNSQPNNEQAANSGAVTTETTQNQESTTVTNPEQKVTSQLLPPPNLLSQFK